MTRIKYFLLRSLLSLAKSFRNFKWCHNFCEGLISSAAYGKALRAADAKNYEAALSALSPYRSGEDDYYHGDIKYSLALLYYYGHGVTKDLAVAERYFIQSANLGNEKALQYITETAKFEAEH